MAHEPGFAKGLSIGIIMDGNGRWAKKRGLPRTAGHTRGAEVFRDIIRYCNELEVACVTFYAFSTENWSRPMEEVNGIMKLFGEYLIMAYDYQKENNRVVFLGDRTALPAKYQAQMNDIEGKTRGNTGTVLNVAVNYGGRQEIVRGMQILARRVQQGLLRPEDIDIETVSGVDVYRRAERSGFHSAPQRRAQALQFYAVAGVLCGICGYGRVMAGFYPGRSGPGH